jgi:hypothetical protein
VLPWVTISGLVSGSGAGTDGANDGWITLVLGVVVVGLALVGASPRDNSRGSEGSWVGHEIRRLHLL